MRIPGFYKGVLGVICVIGIAFTAKIFFGGVNLNKEFEVKNENQKKEVLAPVKALPLLPPPPPKNVDAEPDVPLANPPTFIKAIYATSWSAGSNTKIEYLLKLLRETELNAIVIDIKDFSGLIAYSTSLPLPKQYNAVEVRIPKVNALLRRLHSEGIYVIGRVSVFQDTKLANARPDIAVTSSSTGKVWQDQKGLSWMDPSSRDAWEYNAAIAEEAFAKGFDEINFDYIRFPSDGKLDDLKFPVWDGVSRVATIDTFWNFLRTRFPNNAISADIFGLTTVAADDLGIGQKLGIALPHFDAVAPMVYPSHYASGVFGFAKPAEHPYEVIKNSLEGAVWKIHDYQAKHASSTAPLAVPKTAKLRPWLQDFDLGADYDAFKVREQIRAVTEIASSSPELVSGWMLWSPSNVYTREALNEEPKNLGSTN